MHESLHWNCAPCSNTERQWDNRRERKQPSLLSRAGLWLLDLTEPSLESLEMHLRMSSSGGEALFRPSHFPLVKRCLMGCGHLSLMDCQLTSGNPGSPGKQSLTRQGETTFKCENLPVPTSTSCLGKFISRMIWEARFECKALEYLRFLCLVMSLGQAWLQGDFGKSMKLNLQGGRQFFVDLYFYFPSLNF